MILRGKCWARMSMIRSQNTLPSIWNLINSMTRFFYLENSWILINNQSRMNLLLKESNQRDFFKGYLNLTWCQEGDTLVKEIKIY